MKAVVVFESMYGNTREVAEHVAEGLRAMAVEVLVVPVRDATADHVAAADLVVVGGPTHLHTLARPRTRESAVSQAEPHGLAVEPGAEGVGLREWFDAMPRTNRTAAAAFDTRVDVARLLAGQASKGIASRLDGHGFDVIAPPRSFLVDKRTQLLPDEDQHAVAWGKYLAGLVSRRPATSRESA